MATAEIIKIFLDEENELERSVADTATLSDEIFDAPVKDHYFHEAVRWQRASVRKGTASTKTRGMVRGGGRKMYRQKGTGRSRAGSRRSPLRVGGGVIFGPQPRDYSSRLPKKLRRAALKASLTIKRKEDKLIVVDKIELKEIKTKKLKMILDGLGVESALVVDHRPDMVLTRSARNISRVKVIEPSRLNVYDILLHEHLVFTRQALEEVQGTLAR